MKRFIILSGMCFVLGGTALWYVKPYFVLRMQRATALSCGDLMVSILQPRHVKLGLAGQARNWKYLAYELIEFQEAVDRIARLSPWVAEKMEEFTSDPMAKLTKAVEAQDHAGFNYAYGFRFMNGQIWQQASYSYTYHYAFMPKVLIFRSGGGYKMQVEGIQEQIAVRRLR